MHPREGASGDFKCSYQNAGFLRWIAIRIVRKVPYKQTQLYFTVLLLHRRKENNSFPRVGIDLTTTALKDVRLCLCATTPTNIPTYYNYRKSLNLDIYLKEVCSIQNNGTFSSELTSDVQTNRRV